MWLFVYSLIFVKAFGASCCGGNFVLPTLITNDERGIVTMTSGLELPQAEVDTQGVWQRRLDQEKTLHFDFHMAAALSDRWQFGGTLPTFSRQSQEGHGDGVGDLHLQLGYEYISSLNYSEYLPQAIGFLQILFPTGRTFSEGEALNVGGRGFYAFGLGSAFIKQFSPFDVLTIFEFHRSFPSHHLHPGFGGTWAQSVGYNRGNLRLGANLNWLYEDPVEVEFSAIVKPSLSRLTTAGVSISQVFAEQWALSLGYTDQTLIGSPLNATLSRMIYLSLQYRKFR